MNTAPVISFDDTAKAFAYKTDKDLKKARFLFSSMSYRGLVKLGTGITPWLIKIGLPITGLIRNTIFRQFVGGESLAETSTVAKKLGEYGVDTILDYGVEGGDYGEEGLDHACVEFIRVINYAATQSNIPFISIKMTGIARFGLLEKLDKSVDENAGSLMKRYVKALETLTTKEEKEWQRVHERMRRICKTAAERKVGVLVDAEETWIQDPVDVLTILMMVQFNTGTAVVYNTIQLYRHDRLKFLKDSYEAAETKKFILGAKLVRGAYMEKERRRAVEMNYPSPIQDSKDATDNDYNTALAYCVQHIDLIAFIVASHNENSNFYTTQLLQQKGYSFNHPHVHFSQLYGMSDNISFNLAAAGCIVSKYLPFGPIRDVIPYLMRRAQENSSLSGQTGRELALIKKEIERRGI
ncbi:MAG: proline dehydrogenase family protein [Bacteroidota bacterium]